MLVTSLAIKCSPSIALAVTLIITLASDHHDKLVTSLLTKIMVNAYSMHAKGKLLANNDACHLLQRNNC